MHELSVELSERMAGLAVENIGREYPNVPGHLLHSAADLRQPRELHPAFFGSYDWHSSVHQHWLLVRLLRLDLAGDQTEPARAALAANLTAEALAIEASYLQDRPSFERTYGWAWLLKLADELASWQEPDADGWRRALAPAVDAVVTNWTAFLGQVTYPIRAGTHANSAFGIAMALDHARAAGDAPFASALADRALRWFADDRDYPAELEPGGDDFLSGALMEAAAMSRLLEDVAFAEWFATFLPSPPSVLLAPATVADRSDAKTVHLDGLNLSRAWCWRTVFAATGDRLAEKAAERHLEASIPHLFSGEYVGEHWLSSFALLALTG